MVILRNKQIVLDAHVSQLVLNCWGCSEFLGEEHVLSLEVSDTSTPASTNIVAFSDECIALVNLTLPLNTLSKAHLITISELDIVRLNAVD